MASTVLDIIVLPTYSTYTMAVVDASTYPTDPPSVSTPTIEIEVPGWSTVSKVFTVAETNVFNSTDLGITTGTSYIPIPDGIYHLKYTVNPAYLYYVEKTILRVEKIQEMFDEAFMRLDLMECDKAIKMQSMVDLNTVWFFIQGAIAAANNCADNTAGKLYTQAYNMLTNMAASDCGCCGNNYIINFQ